MLKSAFAAVFLFALAAIPGQAATLSLSVSGIKAGNGMVRVCITRDLKTFPECGKDPGKIVVSTPAKAGTVTLSIPNIADGKVAVVLFVDVNGNKKLDKNFIGIPSEPIGFSNNPSINFGPPKFDGAAINIAGDTATTIKLKYY